MPSDHYMSIAHLIFSTAGQDIENAEKIKTLIKVLMLANICVLCRHSIIKDKLSDKSCCYQNHSLFI